MVAKSGRINIKVLGIYRLRCTSPLQEVRPDRSCNFLCKIEKIKNYLLGVISSKKELSIFYDWLFPVCHSWRESLSTSLITPIFCMDMKCAVNAILFSASDYISSPIITVNKSNTFSAAYIFENKLVCFTAYFIIFERCRSISKNSNSFSFYIWS